MSDNIISIFRKKNQELDSKGKFDAAVAKTIVQSDPQLLSIVKALGISIEEAGLWIVALSNFQADLDQLIYETAEKHSFNPAFSGLLIQAIANEGADQLTGIGMSGSIPKHVFDRFRSNAIQPFVLSKHLEDLSEEDANPFQE
jgi:hypothetical protein